ncbi:MAG: tetratricopeptide repeat protein [Sandaracinaceae bacterium]|nr:tetratricopeptide repeat protein [Sandaracinaceae bacterium]
MGALFREALRLGLPLDRIDRLGQRALGFHEEWFGEDSPHLIEVLEAVLVVDPTLPWPLERLTVLLTVRGEWERLLGHFDRAIAASQGDRFRLAQLLEEAAQIAKEFAGQPKRAIAYLQALFELRPHDAHLFAVLERLLEREERYRDLVELWRKKLSDSPDGQELRYRIARVELDRLGDWEGALEDAQVLMRGGDERGKEMAFEVLNTSTFSLESRRKAGQILRDFYRQSGALDGLEKVLEAWVRFEEGQEAIALRRELGRLKEKRGQWEEAFDQWAALLRLAPEDTEAKRKVEELAEKLGDLRRLARVFEEGAQGAPPEVAGALLVEAGELCLKVGDKEKAESDFRALLALEGVPAPIRVKALRHLLDLFSAEARAKERLYVLGLLAEVEASPGERKEILGQAAKLAEALGEFEQSAAFWQKRLDLSAEDLEAHERLIALWRKAGRVREWVQALDRRMALGVEPSVRRAIGIDIALALEAIGELGEAWERLQGLASEFGEDGEIGDAMVRVAFARGDMEALRGLLGRIAERERRRAVDGLVRFVALQRQGGASGAEVASALARVLEFDPGHEEARRLLKDLLSDPQAQKEAAEALARAAIARGEFEEVLDLLDVRLEHASDEGSRYRLFREAAEIAVRLGELNRGLEYWANVLRLRPEEKEGDALLGQLAQVTGRWSEAGLACAEAAQRAQNLARAIELFKRAAEFQMRGEMGEGAVRSALEALRRRPSDVEWASWVLQACGASGAQVAKEGAEAWVLVAIAQRRLEPAWIEAGERCAEAIGWLPWVRAVQEVFAAKLNEEITRRSAKDARSIGLGELACAIERVLARWYRERLGDEEEARQAMRRAIAHDDSDVHALAELIELERRAPSKALFDALVMMAERQPGRLDLWMEAAGFAAQNLRDARLLRRVLERLFGEAARKWREGAEGEALSAGAGARWAIEYLVALEIEEGRAERAIEWLLELSRLPVGPEERQALFRRAGEIALNNKDEERALSLFEAAVQGSLADEKAVNELAKAYERRGRIPELLGLRKRELGLELPLERRLAVRLEVARLLGILEDSGERLALLRANLAESPGHLPSLRALQAVLESRGRSSELYEVLAAQATQLEGSDPKQAGELWAKCARLAEERLSDPEKAVFAYERVASLTADPMAYEALAQLSMAKGEVHRAAEWLERSLELRKGRDRVPTLLKLAEVRLSTGRHDLAVLALERALAEARDDVSIRERLALLYRSQRSFEKLAVLLSENAELVSTSDPERAVNLAKEGIQLFREELRKPERALPLLELLRRLERLDHETKLALAEVYRLVGRIDDSRALLEELLAEYGRRRSPERAQVHFQLAHVALAQGNLAEALEQLDKASGMDMGNQRILRMLGEVAVQAGQFDRAERAYRGLLLALRRHAPESEAIEVGPSEVFYELARLAQLRGQREQAKELLENAKESAKQHLSEASRFVKALLRARDLALAEEMIAWRLERESEGEGRARALFDRAELFVLKGDFRAALESRLEGLRCAKDPVAELEATERLAFEANAGERYAEAILQMSERLRRKEDAMLVSELLLSAARVLEEAVERASPISKETLIDKAVELLRRVESIGSRVVEAWRALVRIAKKRGDWVEEVRVLRRMLASGISEEAMGGVPLIDPAQRIEALYRIAEVELKSEESIDSGLSALEEAVQGDGNHSRAARLLEQAVRIHGPKMRLLQAWERSALASREPSLRYALLRFRLLERGESVGWEQVLEAIQLAREIGDDSSLEGFLLRAAKLLEEQPERWPEAVWVAIELAERKARAGEKGEALAWLKKAREVVAEAEESKEIELLWRIRELARGGVDPRSEAEALMRLVELQPGNRALWGELRRFFAQRGDRSGHEAAMRRAIERLEAPSERNALRLVLAQSLDEDYGAEEEAIALLREALEEQPDDAEAYARLFSLLERKGDALGVASMLERAIEAARSRGDAAKVAELALKQGAWLEAVDRNQAIESYRMGLDWSPEDPQLLRALYRCLEKEGRTQERASWGERFLKHCAQEEVQSLALELVGLYREAEDEEGVGRVLRNAIERAPNEPRLVEEWIAWLRAQGEWQELADLYARQAEMIQDPKQRRWRWLEAARLYRQTGDGTRSLAVLRQAASENPSDLELLWEFIEAARAAGQPEAALDLLDQVLEAEGKNAQVWVWRAELLRELGRRGEAASALERAARLEPRFLKDWIEALDAYRLELREQGQVTEERGALLQLVNLNQEAGEPGRGLALLEDWIARHPQDQEAIHRFVELATGLGRLDLAFDGRFALFKLASGAERLGSAIELYELAQHVGKEQEVRPWLERLAREEPEAHSLRSLLERIYAQNEEWEQLAALLEAEARWSPPDRRASVLKRWGELLLHRLGDGKGAARVLKEAYALQPSDELILLLADAYVDAEAYDDAVQLLNEAIQQRMRKRTPALAEMQLRMARLAALSGDTNTQLEWLKVAFETDKNNGVIAAELAELAMSLGDDATAMNALKAITLQKTPGPMSKAVAFLRQAQISARQGDRQKAILWARRARVEDPNLTEVDEFLRSLGE